MIAVLDKCQQIMQEGFNASNSEQVDFNRKFEEDIRTYSKDLIKKLFQDVNTGLLRKFNKSFKEDNGKPRDWLRLELPQIDEIWKTSKLAIEALFPLFKYIEIDYTCFEAHTVSQQDSFFSGLNKEESRDRSKTDIPKSKEEVSPNLRRSTTAAQGRLLSEQQINKAKDRFGEDAANALREA